MLRPLVSRVLNDLLLLLDVVELQNLIYLVPLHLNIPLHLPYVNERVTARRSALNVPRGRLKHLVNGLLVLQLHGGRLWQRCRALFVVGFLGYYFLFIGLRKKYSRAQRRCAYKLLPYAREVLVDR